MAGQGKRVNIQQVWSAVYVDALVLRDRNADANAATGDLGVEGAGLEERLYVQQDANFNVTAVTNTSGVVQERFIYDPYGSVMVLDANWATDADGQSDFSWLYLHQGGRYDVTSGLYHFRNREYSATLGRWVQQDPIGKDENDIARCQMCNKANEDARAAISHRLGRKAARNSALWQYSDGANLYQYVDSNPGTRTDASGLVGDCLTGNRNHKHARGWRCRKRYVHALLCVMSFHSRVLPTPCSRIPERSGSGVVRCQRLDERYDR